ncbi:MAG: hypothetical protein P1V97_18135 [Planctomycetota bacterium]|nr:hypothetical protein [Planctomycetota bacterium]
MNKPRPILTSLAFVLFISGCGSLQRPAPALNILKREVISGRPQALGLSVQSGQIILSEAQGPLSYFMNLVPNRFYKFTHAGLIVVEDDGPVVYHLTGELSAEKALSAQAPTNAISGTVRRESLEQYCKDSLYVEVFEAPPETDIAKTTQYVQDAYKNKVPFDPYFNHKDQNKLYCTQFISLALQAGGNDADPLTPVNTNPSLRKVLDWLEIPPDRLLPAGALARPEASVGILGTFSNEESAAAYFYAKEIIYKRFTAEQKIGNLFSLDGFDLKLRKKLDLFIRESIKLAILNSGQSLGDLKNAIDALANKDLGPLTSSRSRASKSAE